MWNKAKCILLATKERAAGYQKFNEEQKPNVQLIDSKQLNK